jgi:hypothetical protein
MMRRSPRGVLILTCLLIAAISSAPLDARAQEDEPAEPRGGNALTGVGAMVCTVVYSPLKIAYAASGLVVGGMAWVWSFGSQRVTRPIFTAALRGDYVVTPEHLTGERRLEFRGRYSYRY